MATLLNASQRAGQPEASKGCCQTSREPMVLSCSSSPRVSSHSLSSLEMGSGVTVLTCLGSWSEIWMVEVHRQGYPGV